MMFSVSRYLPEDKARWDAFVERARNGLFLFRRDYMEYHVDRFQDCSLLLADRQGALVSVLPANQVGDTLFSHGGLTFGGLVLSPDVRAAQSIALLESVATALPGHGIRRLVYKQMPPIFLEPASGEDSYALFRLGARQVRVDANFVVDLHVPIAFQSRRLRSAKKAEKGGARIVELTDFSSYWQDVLVPVLRERHGVSPVHSLSEIELLRERFPHNIRLFVATVEGRVVAGTVLYLYRGVTHAQYIAANDEGRELGALDLVFRELLELRPGNPRFFSFGISTEEQGRLLNEGLAEWKEGFGARLWPHAHFELSV